MNTYDQDMRGHRPEALSLRFGRRPHPIRGYLLIGLVAACWATPSAFAETDTTSAKATSARPGLPETLLAISPALPRDHVNVELTKLDGPTFVVRAGDDLQKAIDEAQRGDTIKLDPRGEWPAVVLPAKPGTGWIHIESLSLSSLPSEGRRVSLGDVKQMPTILNIVEETPRPALNTELRASHYRIMGVHFKSRKYAKSGHNKMLMLGRGKSTLLQAETPDDLPHHIIFDRCIVEGWPGNTTRGLYLDGRHVAVIGCQIHQITASTESHGILLTDTPGPILIENNAIGASGVNIFIGDDNPLRWPDVNTADITIRRNLLYKRPAWKDTCGLKNHFEMKRGQRVLFEHNDCVYSPVDAQTGFSIKLKTGGHDQYVCDVVVRHNQIREANGYMAISNRDATETVSRVLSYQNRFHSPFRGSKSIMFLVEPSAASLTDIAFLGDRLEGDHAKSFLSFSGRSPLVRRLEFRHVNTDHGNYGVKGDSTRVGIESLQKFCDEFIFQENLIRGVTSANSPQSYPRGNRHLP